MPIQLLPEVCVSPPLDHQLHDGVNVSGQIQNQRQEVEARGIQAPSFFVDLTDEAHVSSPEHIVADEVEGAAEVGRGQAQAERTVRELHGPLGSLNRIHCVAQSEH